MNKFLMAAVAASFAFAANAATPASHDKKPVETKEVSTGESVDTRNNKEPKSEVKSEDQGQSQDGSKKTTGNN